MSLVTEGQVLILVGGPGSGKTSRLNHAAAEADGLVLRASGHWLETDVPFAGLHQLLRPVLDRADVLPTRQRAALGVLIGGGGPDRLLLGIAVLNLLSELGPVLLVVDDMQWLDPDSLRVLTFVARRVDGEPIALLGASHQAHFGLPHREIGPPADVVAVPVTERTAEELDDRAAQAVGRGAYGTAVRLLERAGGDRRLLHAAELAILGGYPTWSLDLLARVENSSLAAETALRRGQALALTPRRDAALRYLLDAAAKLPEPLADEALDSAAVLAYYTGRREGVTARSLWARTLTDPASTSAAELPAAPPGPDQLIAHATMAWLLDETKLAVESFERAADLAELPDVLRCAAGWAYLEIGRWAPARLVAAASARSAADGDLPHTAAAAKTLDATVLALQGDVAQAKELATAALAAVTPDASASVIARGRWALGLAATAELDFDTAYAQLRMMFDAGVHYHVTPLAVADLAAAAARTGHAVGHLVDRIVPATRRQRNLVNRARALLAAPAEAEDLFRIALEDSGQWPFEQATTQLDYGEWLRRRGRRTDARLPLRSALETFRRLGSQPWAERTVAELRAAGVRAPAAAPAALQELTPQQQVIVQLAAKGLSNKEIGERLFLSARTIGSHLYRVFPKLGVTSRAQLRDLL